jgi:hypothetical protein
MIAVTKTVRLWLTAILSIACLLVGGQSALAKPPSLTRGALSRRNNCYSLLHQLLDEQKDVSWLRFIKSEHPDIENLTKRIAAASAAGSKLLEELARHDPSMHLDNIRLPAGEQATRTAIASTEKKNILGQTGDEFELTLLLAQTQALSYAWHLAKVGAENDPQPGRARALAGVSDDMESLYHEAFAMLLSKTKSVATLPLTTQRTLDQP